MAKNKNKIRAERKMDCPSGKVTYETEYDVLKAVRDAEVFKNLKLYHYYCLNCFNYHLTSRKK